MNSELRRCKSDLHLHKEALKYMCAKFIRYYPGASKTVDGVYNECLEKVKRS
jgi:hypothetical protein